MRHSFYSLLVKPRSQNEDRARKEFILNVFLCASVFLFLAAFLFNFVDTLHGEKNTVSAGVILLLLMFLTSLLLLSRAGWQLLAAHALIGTITVFAAYLGYLWGVDLPSSLLLAILAVVMAGVLIGTRYAFFLSAVVIAYMVGLSVLHDSGAVDVDRYWREEHWTSTDTVIAGIIFMIIAAVSWLSNREIEKSLMRARRSEAALIEERDLLEVRVQERTTELRAAELERMSQAYRFVEFGRLAGGIFHDLSGPLTALSLNLESIAAETGNREDVSLLANDVGRARTATAHMQKLMEAMRRHLAHEGGEEWFSLNAILVGALPLLTSYAQRHAVSLTFHSSAEIRRHGDPVAFLQAVTNIISNAIESFLESGKSRERSVVVRLTQEGEDAVLTVRDTGPGANAVTQERMFEPFFSTKTDHGGMGIGLPLARRIVERSFGGRLLVESALGKGTTFTLYFPHREP